MGFIWIPYSLSMRRFLSSFRVVVFMLTNESRMISIFWAHCPTSFDYMFCWCLSLGPYRTTHHSNIGVQCIVMLELGTSTLLITIYLKQKWLYPLSRAFGLLWSVGLSLDDVLWMNVLQESLRVKIQTFISMWGSKWIKSKLTRDLCKKLDIVF